MAYHHRVPLSKQNILYRLTRILIFPVNLRRQHLGIRKILISCMVENLRRHIPGEYVRKAGFVKIQQRIGAQQPDALLHEGEIAFGAQAPPVPSRRHLVLVHSIQRFIKFLPARIGHTDSNRTGKLSFVKSAKRAISSFCQ